MVRSQQHRVLTVLFSGHTFSELCFLTPKVSSLSPPTEVCGWEQAREGAVVLTPGCQGFGSPQLCCSQPLTAMLSSVVRTLGSLQKAELLERGAMTTVLLGSGQRRVKAGGERGGGGGVSKEA